MAKRKDSAGAAERIFKKHKPVSKEKTPIRKTKAKKNTGMIENASWFGGGGEAIDRAIY